MQKRVVLIGGGGHASDVLSVYEALSRQSGEPHPVIGLLDDGEVEERRFASRGIRKIGTFADLTSVGATHYIVALGWPVPRRAVQRRFDDCGLIPDTVVHPTSTIPPGVTIGEGTVILANCVSSEGTVIGRHAYLSNGVLLGHDVTIEDYASVMPGASISGDTLIGEAAMIGTNGTVIQGLNVGPEAKVGAGSVVLRDVPAGLTVLGSPAKPLRAALRMAS